MKEASKLLDLELDVTLRGFRTGQNVFNRYTLRSVIGRGGMGVVWLARDESLEREVALKFLPELVVRDKLALLDLKRETNRCLSLTHAHIVRVHDFVEDSGHGIAAISMEYIDGDNLSNLRAEREHHHFEVAELTPWVRQLCDALSYAHEKGKVVHRDLKPANLMLNGSGELKIADFGIARSLVDSASRMSAHLGHTSGTLVYMSPQQALGRAATVADDVYALGATLYDLLTGKPPFYSGNIFEQLKELVPPSIAERRVELGGAGEEIPRAWEETIAACLAKDPAQRPQNITELAARLEGQRPPTGAPVAQIPSKSKPLNPGVPPEMARPRRKAAPISVLVIVLLLLAATGGAWIVGLYKSSQNRSTAAANEAARLGAEELERAAKAAQAAEAAQKKADEEKKEAERMAAARGGLQVTTDPPGATVKIAGAAKGTTPATISDLRLGKCAVSLELSGYDPLEKEVVIEENQSANLEILKLTRSAGTAQIVTEPPGQEFELRLKSSPIPGETPPSRTGKSPATLEKLPTGTYAVTLKRDGWPAHTEEIAVERGKIAALKWEFADGAVDIASEPPGATVLIEGKPVGTTPHRFSGPVGEYRLSLQRTESPDFEGKLSIERGTSPPFYWEFASGTARLSSTPPGANYELRPKNQALEALRAELKTTEARFAEKGLSKTENADLKARIAELKTQMTQAGGSLKTRAGKTPADLADVPAGAYVAVFSRQGWPDKSVELLVSKAKAAEAQVEFAQGTLMATSEPPVATVNLRERVLGKTPLTLELPEGEQTLRFDLPGWPPVSRTVQIARGQTVTAQAAFLGGELLISSEPPGATVTRDGKPLGTTPLTLKNQPPGNYQFELSKSGFKGTTASATVAPREKTSTQATLAKYTSMAGTWVGLVKCLSSVPDPRTYTIYISSDERTVRTTWDGFGGGFDCVCSRVERKGDAISWHMTPPPNSEGQVSWSGSCTLCVDGSFFLKSKTLVGARVGSTYEAGGTLKRRQP